jgi:hypothetical protein
MSGVIGNLDRGRASQRRAVKQNESRRIGARVKARVNHSHRKRAGDDDNNAMGSQKISGSKVQAMRNTYTGCMELQTNMGGI